jgi:hypothetical protein
VPPLSSFFLMLLEFYRLQLQHLSPNSITLVAVFVHLCEMFVGVRPSVLLFRRFFVMKAASQRPPLIGGYYFTHRMQGPSRYIAPVSPGRWERWREDWALVQADAHDRLVIPAAAPTLDRAEWGKDPGLESGFDPVLDRIQYLAESGLTSLMVLHDFLSKCLAPLKDRATRPAFMYTGVNDIMRLERGPGSSLNGKLLVACLKALTTDQFSAELVTPLASCGAICMDQAARTALLAMMPMLDDVDIAVVQRGDLSHGMTIPGATVTGGRGDRPVGSGSACGGLAGGRGRGGSGSPSSAPALGKGKGVSVRVVHDDDEVSSDEDEPLQAWLRSLFPAGGSNSLGTASPDVVVAVKAAGAEVALDRRAAEEAVAKEVADEGSSGPGQAPSFAACAKRVATPSGSSPPAKRPYRGVWRPRYAPKSLRSICFHYFSFPSSRLSPAPRASSVATVASSVAPTAGATILAVTAEAAPELVASGMPQTPEGVPEDVLEDPVDVPEMVPSPSPEEVLAEKAMLVVRVAVPSPPLATAEASSSAPGTVAPADVAADAVGDRRWSWGTPPAMLQATFPWMGL